MGADFEEQINLINVGIVVFITEFGGRYYEMLPIN
jgi:hypothetical protein